MQDVEAAVERLAMAKLEEDRARRTASLAIIELEECIRRRHSVEVDLSRHIDAAVLFRIQGKSF